MKIKIALCSTLFLVGLFVTHFTEANETDVFDDPGPQNPKQIRVYVETIEISALEFAELMTIPTKSSNHTALRNALLAKVVKGEAKLISNQSLFARSGERANVESVKEFIYPTEFEPGEAFKPEKDDTKEEISNFPILPPTPTAFETRNLGDTLEIEPVLSFDGKVVDLTFKPESVKYLGENVMAEWKTKTSDVNVQMPIFYTKRTNTSVTLAVGDFLLVNTYTPEKDELPDNTRKILQFVRAEVLEAKIYK
jgi:Flp pilus assembly secretin CpaC